MKKFFLLFFSIAIIFFTLTFVDKIFFNEGALKGFLELGITIIIFIIIFLMFFSENETKKIKINKSININDLEDEKLDSYTPVKPIKNNIIFNNQNLQEDDVILGNLLNNPLKDFMISDKELNGMCLLLGATGTGKTTAMRTLLENPLKNNKPIVIVDGKGSPSFHEEIRKACLINNRNFKLFSISDVDISKNYNCLRHGGFTELKDKIISIFDWSEEHYKLQAERFLQGVFKLLLMPETKKIIQKENIDLEILSQFLSIDNLQNISEHIGEKAQFMKTILNEVEETAIKGLGNRINSICESELNELFKDTNDEKTIDIAESINNNDVLFFSLDSLKFPEYSKMIGRLIIADLKCVSPKFYEKDKKIYTIFDEFNVFASEIIINLINKTREYGFRNIIATQELADMNIDGDTKLRNQILGNTNVKITLRQDVPESCEILSNIINTKDFYKTNINFEGSDLLGEGKINGNKYSTSLEEDLIYKTREFGQLKLGEAIVVVKFPDFRHAKIKIRRIV